MVGVNPAQICQVILNLATNAAPAVGDKDGLIEVKVDAPLVGDEEIQLYSQTSPGQYLRSSVSDNGSGMGSSTLAVFYDQAQSQRHRAWAPRRPLNCHCPSRNDKDVQ